MIPDVSFGPNHRKFAIWIGACLAIALASAPVHVWGVLTFPKPTQRMTYDLYWIFGLVLLIAFGIAIGVTCFLFIYMLMHAGKPVMTFKSTGIPFTVGGLLIEWEQIAAIQEHVSADFPRFHRRANVRFFLREPATLYERMRRWWRPDVPLPLEFGWSYFCLGEDLRDSAHQVLDAVDHYLKKLHAADPQRKLPTVLRHSF